MMPILINFSWRDPGGSTSLRNPSQNQFAALIRRLPCKADISRTCYRPPRKNELMTGLTSSIWQNGARCPQSPWSTSVCAWSSRANSRAGAGLATLHEDTVTADQDEQNGATNGPFYSVSCA